MKRPASNPQRVWVFKDSDGRILGERGEGVEAELSGIVFDPERGEALACYFDWMGRPGTTRFVPTFISQVKPKWVGAAEMGEIMGRSVTFVKRLLVVDSTYPKPHFPSARKQGNRWVVLREEVLDYKNTFLSG